MTKLHLENVPEFNGQGATRTGLAAVLDTMKQSGARAWLRRATGAAAPAPAPQPNLHATISRTLFSARFSVEQVRGSRLFNVSITSSDPQFAARAADTLAAEYVQFNQEYRTDATRKSLDFLAGEIAKQQKKVEDSERAMAEYRESNNALSLEDRQNTVVASLNQVNDRVHARPNGAHSEGSALQPDQIAAAVGRRPTRRRCRQTPRCRHCARGWRSCSARRCS